MITYAGRPAVVTVLIATNNHRTRKKKEKKNIYIYKQQQQQFFFFSSCQNFPSKHFLQKIARNALIRSETFVLVYLPTLVKTKPQLSTNQWGSAGYLVDRPGSVKSWVTNFKLETVNSSVRQMEPRLEK